MNSLLKKRRTFFNDRHFLIRPLAPYTKSLKPEDFLNIDISERRAEFLARAEGKVIQEVGSFVS